MTDLYSRVIKEGAKKKKDLGIWKSAALACACLLIVIVTIVNYMLHHRAYINYMSSLSDDTAFASRGEGISCSYMDAESCLVGKEEALTLYRMLVYTEKGVRCPRRSGAKGIFLDYGNGSTLLIAPYSSSGGEEGVYVEYDSDKTTYIYRTLHLRYSRFIALLVPSDRR